MGHIYIPASHTYVPGTYVDTRYAGHMLHTILTICGVIYICCVVPDRRFETWKILKTATAGTPQLDVKQCNNWHSPLAICHISTELITCIRVELKLRTLTGRLILALFFSWGIRVVLLYALDNILYMSKFYISCEFFLALVDVIYTQLHKLCDTSFARFASYIHREGCTRVVHTRTTVGRCISHFQT